MSTLMDLPKSSAERLKLKAAAYLLCVKEGSLLLSRRFQTGWQDGNYGLPSGHLERDETLVQAAVREGLEEIDVTLREEDLALAVTMHRLSSSYLDFYFLARAWAGEITNREPQKCDDLRWFRLDALPENMVPSVREAINAYRAGKNFLESSIIE